VELGDRGALAGMDILGAQHDIEPTIHVDDIAFSQRAGDDSHGSLPRFMDSRSAAACPGRAIRSKSSGRNILILRPFASDFRALRKHWTIECRIARPGGPRMCTRIGGPFSPPAGA